MGQKIVEQLVPALTKMSFPTHRKATALGLDNYLVAIRKADDFEEEDNPQPLAGALRVLQTGDSQPYADAGIAYILLTAAREPDGSYYQPGLDAASQWLEKAQASEPDLVDINFLEGLIYIFSQRWEDAHIVLDYLAQQEPDNFLFLRAEVAYWQQQRLLQPTEEAYRKAMAGAATNTDRLFLNNRLADFYAGMGEAAKAIETYKKSLNAQKTDARLWHKLSEVYYTIGNLEEAEKCNRQSLTHGNLSAAHKMTQKLKEKQQEAKKGLRGMFGL